MPCARLLKESRCFCYGYRESEISSLPHFDGQSFVNGLEKVELDPTCAISRMRQNKDKGRPIMMASLGCHVEGLALPHVDQSDTVTAAAGAAYRFARKIPNSNKIRPEFRQFVQKWLVKNMKPLPATSDVSFETWIASTPYTAKRKIELTQKWAKVVTHLYDLEDKYFYVKSFVKDETYVDFKHARAINSRTDEFKCMVGPIFKLISDELFKLPWFIKKVPIDLRPEDIIDVMAEVGAKYVTTDYTSFEAHFDPLLMEDCEMQLIYYMVKHLPCAAQFIALIRKAKIICPNFIFFKNFRMTVRGKRMSGEMDTSLSNGFSNLMIMLFLCKKNGNRKVRGRIEGDDGLFKMTGPDLNPKIFEDFGLKIKMVCFDDLNHASFCGMVFDLDDRTNITDPIAELVSFGWTTARYAKSKPHVHRSLIRCKALSLAYQYPACPILSTLAKKMCELTAGHDVVNWLESQGGAAFNQYEMEMVRKSIDYFSKNGLDRKPGIKTRLLVEQLYNISLSDQYKIEAYIDSMVEIKPISLTIIAELAPKQWSQYYQQYVIPLRDVVRDVCYTPFPQVRPPAFAC